MNITQLIGSLLLSATLYSCSLIPETQPNAKMNTKIDFQGHRGARGLLPENTIPAFLLALSFPEIQTLELDVAVSADKKVIVTHEPYFSHHISSHPDGRPVTEAEEKGLNIYKMTVEELGTFDVGKRGNTRFPDQQPLAVAKPTLSAMVKAIKEFCKKNDRHFPYLDLEIKSRPDYYDIYFPQPEKFVQLVINELSELEILNKTNLQSFDVNILESIHLQAPEVSTSLLVEHPKSLEEHLSTISFKPNNFSPYFEFVTEDLIRKCRALNIKVVPWTVNELKDLQRMVDLEVDGIITDYPNRIQLINFTKNN